MGSATEMAFPKARYTCAARHKATSHPHPLPGQVNHTRVHATERQMALYSVNDIKYKRYVNVTWGTQNGLEKPIRLFKEQPQ